MTKFKFLILILTISLFITSCGSDDSDTTNSGSSLSLTESFNLNVNSENIPIQSWRALRTFDNIEIIGDGDNEQSFYIRFNENGVLDNVDYSENFSSIDFSTSYYYPSKTFTIKKVTIDETNKIINISFEGTLYEDDFDVFDPASTAEVNASEINIKFEENPTATSPDLDTFIDAKINGELFESMKHSTSGVGDIKSHTGTGDGIESLSITFDELNTQVGTYTFSSNQTELVSIFAVDPFISNTGDSVIYENIAGTLTIDNFTPRSFGTVGLINGTFEFTATADGEPISVTEGKFNISFFDF